MIRLKNTLVRMINCTLTCDSSCSSSASTVAQLDDENSTDIDESDESDAGDVISVDEIFPTQIATVVLLPEKPTEESSELLDLAISLKHGDNDLGYSEKEKAQIANSSRLDPKYSKQQLSIEASFLRLLKPMVHQNF